MSVLDQIIGAESGGDPTITNPRSTAGGLGQFINSTWLATIKQHFPQVAQGKSDQQILAMKTDPNFADLQRQATQAYITTNQAHLKANGFEPTDANTYLAHFVGPGGAVKVLQNPGAPVSSLFGPEVIAANPMLRNMTGSDLAKWADNKMTGAPTATTPAQTPAGQQQPPTGLLAGLGISNPFGGTGGALMQPAGVTTPFGDIQIGGGQQGQQGGNDALKALNDLKPDQPQFGSLAPMRRPDMSSFAALNQPIKLGLLS